MTYQEEKGQNNISSDLSTTSQKTLTLGKNSKDWSDKNLC